jgi:hypothetical protein
MHLLIRKHILEKEQDITLRDVQKDTGLVNKLHSLWCTGFAPTPHHPAMGDMLGADK